MYVYNAAWFALAVLLTAGLGLATVWTLRRRGWRPALFMAGLSLMPLALYLTGTLRVLGVIVDQVAGYFVGFVFSPAVWAGVILGGLGVLLMGTAGALKRRGVGSVPKAKQIGPATSGAGAQSPASNPDDGMDDIEAILKRHGIQ